MELSRSFAGSHRILASAARQGNRNGLAKLALEATEGGKHNVAFLALFLLGRTEECMQLLVATHRWAFSRAISGDCALSLFTPFVSLS